MNTIKELSLKGKSLQRRVVKLASRIDKGDLSGVVREAGGKHLVFRGKRRTDSQDLAGAVREREQLKKSGAEPKINGKWITVRGRHVFIPDGGTLEDGLKKAGFNLKDRKDIYKSGDALGPRTSDPVWPRSHRK